MAEASSDRLGKGLLINLSDFTFITFQNNPKEVKKDKKLQYYETPNVGGTDRPIYETGSKSRHIEFLLQYIKPDSDLGVLPQIAFFEKLTYGRNTLTNLIIRSILKYISAGVDGISESLRKALKADEGVTADSMLQVLDVDLQSFIGDALVQDSGGLTGNTRYIRRFSTLYSRLPSDGKPQVLLVGVGYPIPTICDLVNISFRESNFISKTPAVPAGAAIGSGVQTGAAVGAIGLGAGLGIASGFAGGAVGGATGATAGALGGLAVGAVEGAAIGSVAGALLSLIPAIATAFDIPAQLEVDIVLSEVEEGAWATTRRIFTELLALQATYDSI